MATATRDGVVRQTQYGWWVAKSDRYRVATRAASKTEAIERLQHLEWVLDKLGEKERAG